MWVVEACFEGSEDPYKKLLKPGRRYTFGRKPPAELILENKSVSRDAGHIDVGPWEAPPLVQASSSTQPGLHPSAHSASLAITRRPYVRVHAGKKMVRIIGSKDVETWEKDKANFVGSQVLPESDSEVGDGDIIILTMTSPPVTLKWVPLAFCIAARKKVTESDIRDRARELSFLSVPLVLSSNMTAGCTHFVTTTVTPTVHLFEALTALARIVAMTYVDEIIRRGNLNREQADSWEQRFELPDESSFFPTEGNVEGMSLEELKKVYYPNPSRAKLLEGMKFLVATSSETMIKAIDRSEHVYEAAGASIERCSIPTLEAHQDARKALRFLEAKKADHQGPFIILSSANEDAEQPWYGAFAAATKLLQFPMPEGGVFALNKALLYVRTEGFLDQMTDVQVATPAEDQEPSSQQKEKPATPPPASITTTQAVTPSRRLKRRAGQERVDPLAELFGTSNPSTSSANVSAQPEQRAFEETTSESTQRRRRNLGEGAKAPRRSELWRELLGTEHSAGQAPKATPVSSVSGSGDTERYTKRFRMELDEAEQKATQRKRDAETDQQERREHERVGEDPEDIADGAQDAQDTHSAKLPEKSKRNGIQRLGRAEGSDASPPELEASGVYVQETPASTQSGVTTDQKFLQSVASMKRNAKKRMNDFDREFDQLRLSKPSAGSRTRGTMKISGNINEEEDEEYRAWNEMDEDDFNISAAGNFVQVDFVPLLRPRPEMNGDVSMSNGNEDSETSRQRPNFKKFKNKDRPKRRPLQLDLPELADFGISTTYGVVNAAKRNKSREERQSSVFAADGQDSEEPEKTRGGSLATQQGSMRQTPSKSIFNTIRVGDDDQEEDVPPPPRSTARTRQASGTPGNASQRTQNARSQSIEDSDQGARDAIDLRLDIDDNDDSFLQSSKQKRDKGKEKASSSSSLWAKPSSAAAQAPKDSSQRLVPSKRSARSRAAESDSSSDGGFSFKGFKRTR